MNKITISNLDDDMKSRLQKRDEQHGHSLEEDAREILLLALTENQKIPVNIVTKIEQRFAKLVDFELPEITREPIRNVSIFEE
ncbi:plasmid stability protein [Nostoc linckia FACHB-104]|nr:plasmid stability protein [Nostoc linckia FACHB-104]